MTLPEIKTLAIELMTEHGLIQKGWALRFDNSKRRAGLCNENKRLIGLSKVIVPSMKDEDILDTILHEIAHALVGCKHGHNKVWQRKAREIGCSGKRCYNDTAFKEGARETIIAQSKYTLTCPNCGEKQAAHRKFKRKHACYDCCNKYAGGKYSEEYEFIITQNY